MTQSKRFSSKLHVQFTFYSPESSRKAESMYHSIMLIKGSLFRMTKLVQYFEELWSGKILGKNYLYNCRFAKSEICLTKIHIRVLQG